MGRLTSYLRSLPLGRRSRCRTARGRVRAACAPVARRLACDIESLEQRRLMTAYTLTGTAAAETWTVRVDAAGTHLNIWNTDPDTTPPTYAPPLAFTEFDFNGGGGDDQLIVDTAGSASVAPIYFNGGDGDDTIRYEGPVEGNVGEIDASVAYFNWATIHDDAETRALAVHWDAWYEQPVEIYGGAPVVVPVDLGPYQNILTYSGYTNGIRFDVTQHFNSSDPMYPSAPPPNGLDVMKEGADAVLVVTSMPSSIFGMSGTTIDLNDNAMIWDYSGTSPISSLRSFISNGSSNDWTGTNGIRSTSAHNDPNHAHALGYAEASALLGISGSQTATWHGQTVDATSLLVMYTWAGDANLDGQITPDDYALTDYGAAAGKDTWVYGDFNYDAAVDADDIALIDAGNFVSHPTPADNLTAIAKANATRVDLSWTTNSSVVTSFSIDRSDDGGITYTHLDDVLATDPLTYSDVDTALEPGTTYTYRVIATDGNGHYAQPVTVAATTSSFVTYNAMSFSGMPDMQQYGAPPVFLAATQFFDNYNVDNSTPSETATRAFADWVVANGNKPVVIDLEQWAYDIRTTSQTVVDATIAKFVDILQWMHDEAPTVRVGVYATAPIRDYWTPNLYAPNSPQYLAWQAANDYLQPIADEADFVCPSLYTFYGDPAGWEVYAQANIAEAARYGKPVLPFLWMQYHGSNPTLGGTYLPAADWANELALVRDQADGVVIWGGWQTQWDTQAEWWNDATVPFLIDLTPADDFTASAMANTTRIDLSWTSDSPVATSFSIDRSDDGGVTYTHLADVLATDPLVYTDVDADLEPGVTYTYRITATDGDGHHAQPVTTSATTSSFVTYNAMSFSGMPDMQQYGVPPVFLAATQFFDNYNVDNSTPSETATRAFADWVVANGNKPVVIDLEQWAYDIRSASTTDVDATIAKFVDILQWMHDEAPGVQVGVYGIAPIRDYWTPNLYAPNSPQYLAWQAANDYLQPIADEVDFVCPSLYTFYDDPTGWDTYAQANIAEAARYGKPVVPFLWMQYHGSNPTLGGTFLPAADWAAELDTVRDLADGVVIWGGWQQTWDSQADWWTDATEPFLSDPASA